MSNSIWATVVLATVSAVALAAPVPKEAPLIPHPTLKIGAMVDGITFSGDNKFLATSTTFDGKVMIWDLQTGKCAEVCLNNRKLRAGRIMAFSPDGKYFSFVHVGGRNGREITHEIWDTSAKKVTASLRSIYDLNTMTFSPDGKILAVDLASGDGAVQLLESATGKELMTIEKTEGNFDLMFHSDGKVLFGSGDNGIRGWEVATGRELVSHKAPGTLYTGLAISPDGKTLVSSNGDLKLFDMTLGKENSLKLRKSIPLVEGISFGLGDPTAFSPDGTVLAVAIGKTVCLWDVATGQVKATLKSRQDEKVLSVAFRADGKVLAIGNDGGTVQLWDVAKELNGGK